MVSPSQIMAPYRRFSLMRWRAMRRLRYGRGHGIHSPLAYASVYSILRPYSSYYIEDEEIAEVMTEEERIWYRMAARLCPSETRYALSEEGLFRTVAERAVTAPYSGGPVLMVTDSADEARRFFSSVNPEGRSPVLLYTGIREDRASEKAFLTFLHSLKKGVVLDFYAGALIFNNNQEKYYYRTTL